MTCPDDKSECEYTLLDCGNGRRLERFGNITVNRPAPMADNPPALTAKDWDKATVVYSSTGNNQSVWDGLDSVPDPWIVSFGAVRLSLVPSPNGQLGVFPEQLPNWRWLTECVQQASRPLRILNAFAYTGAATLAASTAQTEVVHLDASKPAVAWARRNAELNEKDTHTIRWIVDDALTFLRREEKRGHRYDGIILDPPAFGRGKGKATWKLERDLPELLHLTQTLLSDASCFYLLSCHPTGWTTSDLERHLRHAGLARFGAFDTQPLSLLSPATNQRLPLGVCCRWNA